MSSIFDIFTNNNAQQAAQDQIQGLTQGYGLASGDINKAIAALTQQFGLGQGALTTGASTATNAVNAGNTTATNAINAGTGTAAGALSGNYAAALLPFLQNYQVGATGQNAYADALGLNGPAGNSRATTAFWNNPGIQSQLDIGSQNVLRNAAQTGTLASGATDTALQNFGQQTASQNWGQYVSQLAPFLSTAGTAASGAAGVNTGLGSSLANLFTGQGTNLANLATGTGSQLSNIATGTGAQSANLFSGLGTGIANQYGNLANLGYQFGTGVGNANANAALANNNASANMVNAIGSGIGMLAMFSDERLKEDIAPVGELFDGTNVYRYRYVWDDPAMTRIGVMAQEVEQTRPDAVHDVGGFKAVDYNKATELASLLSQFADAANDDAPKPSYADTFAEFMKAA